MYDLLHILSSRYRTRSYVVSTPMDEIRNLGIAASDEYRGGRRLHRMITVTVGNVDRPLEEATPDWINHQINRRRGDGISVCVRVTIKEGDVNVILTTPSCNGTGGGRQPNPREQAILDLWHHRGLREPDFTGGNVVAFLRQLSRLI